MPFDTARQQGGLLGKFLGVVFAEVDEGGGGGGGLVEGEDCGGGMEFRDGCEADLSGVLVGGSQGDTERR